MNDEKNRGDRRAETARQNDDSKLTENKPDTPDTVGRAGGNLQRDVATADPEKEVRDPEAKDSLHKEQEGKHGSSTARRGT